MRSVFGRAVVVAGALVMVLGSATAAIAKPRPPMLAFAPSPYHYGRVATGQTASQTFTLTDSGGQATGRLRVKVAGAAAFTIAGDTCHSLGRGKTCAVTVQFTPAHAGRVTAVLTAVGRKGAATATDALSGTGKGLGSTPGHMYWATDGTISEAGLDGSNPQVLVTGQTGSEALAVGASHLYWTNNSNGTISEANLNGSDPHVIVSGVLSHGVAVDASHLYWTSVGDGSIYEANLDGTNPQAIVSDQSDPWGVAVDASHLYWTNPRAGTVWTANLDGTNPESIVSGQDFPTGVTVGGPPGGLLYWADTSSGEHGTIDSASLDGSSPSAVVTSQDGPVGVAVDSASVYWANPNGGTVNVAGLNGSFPHALFSRQDSPYGVALGP